MSSSNKEKRVPKSKVKFQIQLSEEQKQAKAQILNHSVSFITGKAGTGKTLLATNVGLDSFFSREIDKIVITRPTIGTENNGFLPGDEKEKMQPWMIPLWHNFTQLYPHKEKLEGMEKAKWIEMVSLAFFRGRTFHDAVVIVDEFQNLSYHQIKMVITRLGKNSKMIFCGDAEQCDLEGRIKSAVVALEKLQECPLVYHQELVKNHRHPDLIKIMGYL